MMKKKGISPLIATVLIIGFTVGLAAVIMTWGQSFIKGMQESTAKSTEQQLTCTERVGLEVGICNSTDNPGTAGFVDKIKVVLDNKKEYAISDARIRVTTASGSYVKEAVKDLAFSGLNGLSVTSLSLKDGAAAQVTLTTEAATANKIRSIEVIPIITVDGQSVTCQALVASLDLTNAKRWAGTPQKLSGLDLC